jgi:replicative DNA helicase
MTERLWSASISREPPGNEAAEQSLLGALLANNGVFTRVSDFLRSEHFLYEQHGQIFDAIVQRILDGRLADAVTITQDFENTGMLDDVGGKAYFASLLAAMVGINTVADYGRTIYDGWLRRQLISIGEAMVERAFAPGGETGQQQMEAAERALADLRVDGVRRDRLMSIGEAVAAAIRQSEEAYRRGGSPAVVTGLPTLDRATGGFWPGDFSLLGGIPGAGKTALAVQVACMIAERRYQAAVEAGADPVEAERQPGVALFSLEMSAEELGARVAAARAGISVERLRGGHLTTDLAAKLLFVERGIAGRPVRIHDCRETNMKLLGAKMRMHLKRQPECLGIVDHLLQLDSTDDRKGRSGGIDAASVTRTAREFKRLAGDTGLPLLVLTHVPRGTGRRDNPRPTMSDVKWGGEGDADNVFFVHRPIMFMDAAEQPAKFYRESEESHAKRINEWRAKLDRSADLAEFIVAKRRMGGTGVFNMRWDGPSTSFSEWVTMP